MTLTYGWINFQMQILGFFHKILLIVLEWNHITFCNEYIVNLCISVSIILNSTNIDVQNQIMPTHEFHSLLQKMNNEHIIFYDVMYKKNKIQMNQFIYSLLEVLIQVKLSH